MEQEENIYYNYDDEEQSFYNDDDNDNYSTCFNDQFDFIVEWCNDLQDSSLAAFTYDYIEQLLYEKFGTPTIITIIKICQSFIAR